MLVSSYLPPPPPPLSGTAGQSGDVLFKAERGELQRLYGGEIRKDGLGELVGREATFDGKCRRLNAVASLRRKDVGAEQPTAACFGYQLHEAACVTRRESPRHLVEVQYGGSDVEATCLRRSFGQAYASDLGISES